MAMLVRDVMTPDPVVVGPDVGVAERWWKRIPRRACSTCSAVVRGRPGTCA